MADLPLPNPFSWSIPAVGQQFNELQKGSAEAKYAAANARANALSKTAYAQYRPAEIAAQMMLSPAFRQLDPNTQNAMIQRYASQLNNPMQSQDILQPNDNVFSMLMNYLTGGKGGQSGGNPMARQPAMGGGGQSMGGAPSGSESNGYQYDQNGKNVVMPPDQVAQIAQNGNGMIGSGTPAAGQTAGQTTPGSTGGYGPVDAAAAQAETAKTALVGQQQNQNEQQKQRSQAISNQATVATQAGKILDGWYRNYKKSSYRGQYAGSAPASGVGSIPTLPGANAAPEQLADSYSNQYLTQLSALGDTPAGKTDEGRAVIAAGKVNRSLDDDAAKELYESQKAGLHRMARGRHFANDFYKNNPNATDEQLVAMMNLYNEYAPSYDYENGKPLPKNDKNFKDFTSARALESYKNNGDYNPYAGKRNGNVKSENQPTGVVQKMQMIGKKHHAKINGIWYEVGE